MNPITMERSNSKDRKRVRRGSWSDDVRLSKRTKTETTSITIFEPRDQDVLLGSGVLSNKHPGNHVYEQVLKLNKDTYGSCACKREKFLLAMSIVLAIQGQSTPGRFLQLHKERGYWYEVNMMDALEKTFQDLRQQDAEDKANEHHAMSSVVPKMGARNPFSNPFKTIISSSSEKNISSSSKNVIPESKNDNNNKHETIVDSHVVKCNSTDQWQYFDSAPLPLNAAIMEYDDGLTDMLRDIFEDPTTDDSSVSSASTHTSGDTYFL